MVEQNSVAENLLNFVDQQITNAQNLEQHARMLKSLTESQRPADELNQVAHDRAPDSKPSAEKNPSSPDQVCISPEARELYQRQAAAAAQALEKTQDRRSGLEPLPEPKGSLGPLEPAA